MNSAYTSRPHAVQTVSELTARIKAVLDATFSDVAVVGEISNFKRQSSGHWYFSLKDAAATLPAACFRQANSRIKFDLEDGMKVVAYGKLEIYPPKGGYQLIVTKLEPVGIGQWQLAFDQLKQKLEKEGLLDAARKRPIPLMPKKIGIVTSPTAAALRDIITALRRRNKNVRMVISPTRVQGDGVEHEIAQAIKDVQTISDVEVLIVARGGGSIEDLWCFNTEVVARAVAECRVPVIAGIGHETDITICDLVADLRAPTPTAAAELVARGRAEMQERWGNLSRMLLSNMEFRIAKAHRALEKLNPRHALARQEEKLNSYRMKLANTGDRMTRLLTVKMIDVRHKLESSTEKLHALSPLNTLSRGFAIVRKPDGTVVQEYTQVKAGDQVEAWLQRGKLKLTVESTFEEWQQEGSTDD